jgi:hypothetical protein
MKARLALPTLAIGWIALLGLGALSRAALAGSPATDLHELHERERQLEQHREQSLRKIQQRIEAQTLDAEGAVMARSKVNHDYQNAMNHLRSQQDAAYRALGEKRRPRRDGSGSGVNPAIPRIPSQSVITYPQGGEPETEGGSAPQAEGRQKNVGFGTNELEFQPR